MEPASEGGWLSRLSEILNDSARVNLVGIGNPIKQDDSLGLNVISNLLRAVGPHPTPNLTIHRPSLSPERGLSKLAAKGERIVVIDAVEANREPGAIVFARVDDTKFGFFVTHNVPLKLVLGSADAYILGIQPESIEVGEDLSDCVDASCSKLISAIVGIVREPHG